MKTTSSPKKPLPEDALDRYDWSRAKRGRHAARVRMGTPMRQLDEDLAEIFPNSAAVNAALRAIVALGKALPRRSTPSGNKRRSAA